MRKKEILKKIKPQFKITLYSIFNSETANINVVENQTDLDQRINQAGDKLVVVEFFAKWCGPCKLISPRLEEQAIEYAKNAIVLKVDVDKNEEIAAKYNIACMPTFVFIKHGKILKTFIGNNSEELIESFSKCTSSNMQAHMLSTVREQQTRASTSTRTATTSTAASRAATSATVSPAAVCNELSDSDLDSIPQ